MRYPRRTKAETLFVLFQYGRAIEHAGKVAGVNRVV